MNGFSQRLEKLELMDTSVCTDQEMMGVLRFLKITNRYFGGCAVILKVLNGFSASWRATETIKILDVGCGLADIPIAIVQWAKSKNIKVEITGLELVPQIVSKAREHTKNFSNVRIEQRNIFDLNEEEESYDYCITSLFLHHIPSLKLPQVLRKLNRIAKRGLILSDLERSLLGYAAVTLLSCLIGNRIVWHDGPLSVQRSFTIRELKDLTHSLGLDYLKARKEPFFRISLAGEKQ
ncbi:MAG: methyltransferase domain-containing protein [Elusimicrobia bacterium]|nr:methyltransferase domain-containing protein [Elusimicrobiota bacterium]